MSGEYGLEELRDEAAELGIAVDGRWGVDRLRQEIAAAAGGVGEPEAPKAKARPKPSGVRAGGHVLVDGRWVIDK